MPGVLEQGLKLTSPTPETVRMREASGRVVDGEPLTGFFYLLARDHLAVGVIETVLDQAALNPGESRAFTNGWLARWAQDAAARMRKRA